MIVLVCGGRDFDDAGLLYETLDRLHGISKFTRVIHGGAAGADALAGQWAERRGIIAIQYKADWAKHGRAAGPLRNKQMLEVGRPELVVAFSGGRGTADMVRQAKRAGVSVLEVRSI